MKNNWLAIFVLACAVSAQSKTIHVPSDYSTIQAAINAASMHDTLMIAEGRYNEQLTINKSLSILGSGTANCIIHKYTSDASPVILVQNAAVWLKGFEIIGSEYDDFNQDYMQFASKGLVTEKATMALENLIFNNFSNCMVTISGGGVNLTNVQLWTRIKAFQCDLGIALLGCIAFIDGLRSESGHIDHSIEINGYFDQHEFGTANVSVKNCSIAGSALSWGNGLRAYARVNLTVENCAFYRNPGGQAKGAGAHNGIGFNANETNALVRNNTFNGLPTGIDFYGSFPNSNRVKIEQNTFLNIEEDDIAIAGTNYEGIDLGGGTLGSLGGNHFSSIKYDVRLLNSSATIYAKYNWWSDQLHPRTGIWDKYDDPQLGEVIFGGSPLKGKFKIPVAAATNVPIHPELSWEQFGGADTYALQIATNEYFRSPVVDQRELKQTSCIQGPLEYHTKYYCRVGAYNNFGFSGWNEVLSFETTYPKPAAPALLAPANGAIDQPALVTLRWGVPTGAVTYHVQVSKHSDLTSIIIEDSTINLAEKQLGPLPGNIVYYWHARAMNAAGQSAWSSTYKFRTKEQSSQVTTSERILIEDFRPSIFPNPFNNRMTISFVLPFPDRITLTIYDCLGREVNVLKNQHHAAGRNSIHWEAGNLPSGLYFCRLQASDLISTTKFSLLR